MKKIKHSENYNYNFNMLVKFRNQLDKDRIKLSLLSDKYLFIFSLLVFFYNLFFGYNSISYLFIFISICCQFLSSYYSKKAFMEQVKIVDEAIRSLPKDFRKENYFYKILDIFEYVTLITFILSIGFIK